MSGPRGSYRRVPREADDRPRSPDEEAEALEAEHERARALALGRSAGGVRGDHFFLITA